MVESVGILATTFVSPIRMTSEVIPRPTLRRSSPVSVASQKAEVLDGTVRGKGLSTMAEPGDLYGPQGNSCVGLATAILERPPIERLSTCSLGVWISILPFVDHLLTFS
jgi:hypothetical protein